MVSNQPNDPLTVGGGQSFAGVGQTARQPIDPQSAIWIEHHLDNVRIFQEPSDCWTQRRAQHACSAGDRFRLKRMDCHSEPPES
jgi:hypothetical protein